VICLPHDIPHQPKLDLPTQFLGAVREVLESDSAALHEPLFAGDEKRFVNECIETGWVSSVGRFVDQFEQMLADYTGVDHAVAVVNGTAALHVALKLAGVEPDDEVLVPALTFVATANAVSYLGALPHFVDSEEVSLGIDPRKLADHLSDIGEVRAGGCQNRITGRRIRAVVPMHTFGHPVDLDALQEVCARYHLTMVEDAAEALGSYYKGRHAGGFGRLAVLSFNGNKIITTGGGGAILTNDPRLGEQARHITTTAKVSHAHSWEYLHDQVGFNYRLPNLNAALGCAQLAQLPSFLERKRALAERYALVLRRVPGVRHVAEPPHCRSNFWLNAALLDPRQSSNLGPILELANQSGVQCRPAWVPMHRLPMYEKSPRMDLSTAESLCVRLINLPSSVRLAKEKGLPADSSVVGVRP
jgi:perosamine synthetase